MTLQTKLAVKCFTVDSFCGNQRQGGRKIALRRNVIATQVATSYIT